MHGVHAVDGTVRLMDTMMTASPSPNMLPAGKSLCAKLLVARHPRGRHSIVSTTTTT